jgi:GTP-binding protein
VPEGYKRYLINGICEAFDMHGEPLRLFVRQGKNPYAGKVGPDGPPRYKRPRE